MACYWRAMALDSTRQDLWLAAGETLHALGRRDEALAVLGTARDRWPDSAETWFAVAKASGDRAARETALRRGAALAPDHLEIHKLLVETISSQEPEHMLLAAETVIGLAENDPAGHRGAGRALLRLGRLEEAAAALAMATELAPGDVATHRALAELHFLGGKGREAWRHFAESRPMSGKPAASEWNGSDPAGKVIAVVANGSLDDALPLLGAIPDLARRGAKVTLKAPRAWLPLLSGLDGAVAVDAVEEARGSFDAQIALSRLPWRLGWTEVKPSTTKLAISPKALPVPLGTRLKVGLLWSGASEESSIGLAAMLPLTGLAGATFYGLQTGPAAHEAKKLADPGLVIDLSAELGHLGDLAAAVAALDLVIAVEGPMAALAQAVGTPVWLLLPRYSDQYVTTEVFRQKRARDWRDPLQEVGERLKALLKEREPEKQADIVIHSIFPDAEGNPRFRMTAPRSYLADPGVRFLAARERSGVGYEYATRSFLDAHLHPGDLFLDIGAHWGIMSLQAATRWPGRVNVLAVEPSPHNLPHLRRWLAANKVADQVEVIGAFAADAPGKGRLKPQSTMGHSLIRAEDGAIPVVTVDGLLADRPRLSQAGRVVIKIDVEGHEPDVIEGMRDLLGTGKVATVIWERGREYDTPAGQQRLHALRRKFASLGFTAWRFESEDAGGDLVPFVEDGSLGNIFELGPREVRLAAYGAGRPAPVVQPADAAFDAAIEARSCFARGLKAHQAGKTTEARDLYRRAAMLDATMSGPFNNIGALFRAQSNRAASVASFRRGHRLAGDDVGVMSNFGNALREAGEYTEAEQILRQALAMKPDDAGLIYKLGVLRKDTDRPGAAVALFERALRISTDDPEYSWDRSLALLQAGDYVAGFDAYESRWGLKRATKRKISLPVWDGSPLAGRSIFLSDEQGFGDVLQWARFVAPPKQLGAGRIVMECQPELMRLMSLLPEVDAVVPRAKEVPQCDLTLPLLSLPRVMGTRLDTLPVTVPYLRAPEAKHRLREDGRLKLGLVWAGKPTPRDRSIDLKLLLPLLGDPGISAYSLQMGARAADIGKLGAELLITDLAPMLGDFAETAAVLTQLDLLISVDTAVAHLAGALGVKTFLLLRRVSDWRWFDERADSPWYPTMTLFRQEVLDRWGEPLKKLTAALQREVSSK